MSLFAELVLAGSVVSGLALLSFGMKLGLERLLMESTARACVQLFLIALVLRSVFGADRAGLIFALLFVMTLLAARAAMSRVRGYHRGLRRVAFGAMVLGTWSMTALAVFTVFRSEPWYAPRVLIPFAGILLGNCLSGISVGMDQWLNRVQSQRETIEMLLAHGATRGEAVRDQIRESLRTALLPILNSMMIAGIVSLPGMMVGQILAGADPMEASRTQIAVLVLIAAGTFLGSTLAIGFSFQILFNSRHQFLAERLETSTTRKEDLSWHRIFFKRTISASASATHSS